MVVWIETEASGNVQAIAGDELVKVLQIRNKIPRRKALSSLEEKVLKILTENGFVSNDSTLRSNSETIAEILEVEDEDEEVIVDGEVDEGDVHIKPTPRKPALLVSTMLISKFFFFFSFFKWIIKWCIYGILGSVLSVHGYFLWVFLGKSRKQTGLLK